MPQQARVSVDADHWDESFGHVSDDEADAARQIFDLVDAATDVFEVD